MWLVSISPTFAGQNKLQCMSVASLFKIKYCQGNTENKAVKNNWTQIVITKVQTRVKVYDSLFMLFQASARWKITKFVTCKVCLSVFIYRWLFLSIFLTLNNSVSSKMSQYKQINIDNNFICKKIGCSIKLIVCILI